MALFSRRCLRRMLTENSLFLQPDQVAQHVSRLDKVPTDLSTEWEIAILNVLHSIGTVEHEPPDLGGSRFMDVVFSSPAIQFAADIVTVSDKPAHERNPVDRIWEELARRVYKQKITTGGFNLNIGASPDALNGLGVRHDLLLPPISKFGEVIFNQDFDAFLKRIKNTPSARQQFRVRDSTRDISIDYDPDAKTWGGSHLSYTGANVLDRNPVFNALKTKVEKLKLSGYSGPRGIIVCDGGCQMLTTGGTGVYEYTLRRVVADFLRQNQSVAFVATIGLRQDSSVRGERGRYKPVPDVFVPRTFAALREPLARLFGEVARQLSLIETSAENAVGRAEVSERLGAGFGGYQLGGDKYMKISAISALQLFAGKLDYASFAAAHGFGQRNPFADALHEGRVIRNCKIETGGEEDDDWITFEFGEPDAAVA